MSAYLAFDLETVIDADLARAALGCAGTDSQVRSQVCAHTLEKTKGRSDFPKPLYHRVVAVGLAAWSPTSDRQKVEAKAGGDEVALLTWFLEALASRPTLVSFNGRGFDLPVVMHRALIHRLPSATLYGLPGSKAWDKYGYRYDGPHLDVADVLTNYGGGMSAGLHELAIACDLPGKSGVSGEDVEALFEAGDWPALEQYVGSDAAQTLALGLRLDRTRRRITTEPTLGLDI
jgi:hypothetical protein